MTHYTEDQIDAADDELQGIVDFKASLEGEITHRQKWHPEIDLTEMKALIEEAFDDAHYKAWHKNAEISGSIGWPSEIPPFGTLTFKTPRQIADENYRKLHAHSIVEAINAAGAHARIVTNPDTYAASGEAL